MAIKEVVLTEFDTADIDVMRDIISDALEEMPYKRWLSKKETEGFGFKIVVFINDGEDV